jgi:hypothetical protein
MTLDHLHDRDSSADDSVVPTLNPLRGTGLASRVSRSATIADPPANAINASWRARKRTPTMWDPSRAGFLVALQKPKRYWAPAARLQSSASMIVVMSQGMPERVTLPTGGALVAVGRQCDVAC